MIKKGPKYVVYPCLLAFTIGLVALGYTNGSIMMIISGGLIGIGYGSVTPVFQTQIISSVEPHKIGVANSLFFNAMDAGMAIGAFIMGMMVESVGYRMIYVAGAVLVVLAGALYAVQMKKTWRDAVGFHQRVALSYISISISPFALQQQGKISPGWINAKGSVIQST